MKRALAITVAFAFPLVALAAIFPDIPEGHPNANAIEGLYALGVVQGNPDGTFAPDREVNRAEILTMLYRAAGKTPRAVFKRCFPDVAADSWYEEVVCDAAHARFVDGHPDGTFRPEMSVNSVEGLKMVLNVLGFTVPTLTQADRLGLDFLQVSHGSWYAPYLHRALALNLIPKEYIANNNFNPSLPLDRKGASEIIYRALFAEDTIDTTNEESEEDKDVEDDKAGDEAEGREPSPGVGEGSPGAREPSEYVEVEVKPPEVASFPFHRSGKTAGRGSAAYTFDLAEPGTILLQARNITSPAAGISCFLYELGDSGLPETIYIGFQESGACFVRAGARAGNYQFEVRTAVTGDAYSVDAEKSTGDGNDGPMEAIELRVGFPRTAQLRANDYEDWFHFRLSTAGTYRVNSTPVEGLLCTILPRSNVDVFGFKGPECGQTSEFQPGDYDISIQRLAPPAAQSYFYTIDVR